MEKAPQSMPRSSPPVMSPYTPTPAYLTMTRTGLVVFQPEIILCNSYTFISSFHLWWRFSLYRSQITTILFCHRFICQIFELFLYNIIGKRSHIGIDATTAIWVTIRWNDPFCITIFIFHHDVTFVCHLCITTVPHYIAALLHILPSSSNCIFYPVEYCAWSYCDFVNIFIHCVDLVWNCSNYEIEKTKEWKPFVTFF